MIKLIRATLICCCMMLFAEAAVRHFNTGAFTPFLFGWYACVFVYWEKLMK